MIANDECPWRVMHANLSNKSEGRTSFTVLSSARGLAAAVEAGSGEGEDRVAVVAIAALLGPGERTDATA